MEHTFTFTEGKYQSFDCNPDMPCLLYDELREVVKQFYNQEGV